MTTGPTNDPDSLQDLRYKYDKVGNVKVITDTVALGGPQIQTFSYDTLDRLVTAQASGGTGGTYGQDTYQYNGTTGNLSSKAGVNYTYSAQATCNGLQRNIAHAVSAAGSNSYAYDCNGNMVTRNVGSIYTLSYDAESRLVSVTGGISASFVFDGDGNRVKATVAGVTTAFVGGYYEWTSNANTLYYSAGGARVAMRRSGYTSDNGLFWIMGDHLGSTSIVANADGSLKSMLLYKAWGEVRYSTGVANTKYTFTGQYTHVPDFGLMFYVARWYDPALGRFAQADTMGEGDRYAYVNNNPVRYNDPSGHRCEPKEDCENDPEPEPEPESEEDEPIDLTVELSAEAQKLFLLYLLFQKTNGWWSSVSGDTLMTFLAIILSREAFPAWRDDGNWFTGEEDDPSQLFAEAGARWFSTWSQDALVKNTYGEMSGSEADKEAMLFNWIAAGLQSADHLSIDTLQSYSENWNDKFLGIASDIYNPSDPERRKGDGMWSWGNAYLFTKKGQGLLSSNNVYQFGSGDTAWYIFNANNVRTMDPYKKPQ